MWERTITIGSAGKTFSVTGWKTGWAYGPENLIKNMQVVHQNILNSVNTPAQVRKALTYELAFLIKKPIYLFFHLKINII